MQKICKKTAENFKISEKELELLDKISPSFNGKKYSLPTPTLSPNARLQRRLTFRNEQSLYQRKSDLSGKSMVCMYSSDKPYKVYDQDEWWSDAWDPLDYGRDFDFNRSYFEQFAEFELEVPHNALYTIDVENSQYTNFTLHTKNCYLHYGGGYIENLMYSNYVSHSRDCMDSIALYDCELCYEGIASKGCYDCMFFNNCQNCNQCIMVEDCASCSNCILCFGLYQKEYYFLNEYVGKEKYLEYRENLKHLSEKNIRFLYQELVKLKANIPHRASHIYSSEDCTGDVVFNSKDCMHSFDINECEDCAYLLFMPKSHMAMDACFGAPDGSSFSYEVCSAVNSNAVGIFNCWYSDSVYYSKECMNSRDLFGCMGLKNKQYCIFNKQYSKEEYHKLAAKIVEHMIKTNEWGEYFPISMSPFGYNETIAYDHFPITKEEAVKNGWKWKDDEEKKKGEAGELAETIEGVDESICQEVLYSRKSGNPYKIIPQEFKFYKKMGLPIPSLTPKERFRERFSRKAPRRLYPRVCAETGKEIMSPYESVGVVAEDVFLERQR